MPFLLFARMFPISPSWLLNIVAPFLNIPLPIFAFSAFVGKQSHCQSHPPFPSHFRLGAVQLHLRTSGLHPVRLAQLGRRLQYEHDAEAEFLRALAASVCDVRSTEGAQGTLFYQRNRASLTTLCSFCLNYLTKYLDFR